MATLAEDVNDLVTWCKTCSRWFSVIGANNFFQHVILNHPATPIGVAVNEALAEMDRRRDGKEAANRTA
jgi:hypothetical protein